MIQAPREMAKKFYKICTRIRLKMEAILLLRRMGIAMKFPARPIVPMITFKIVKELQL